MRNEECRESDLREIPLIFKILFFPFRLWQLFEDWFFSDV